MKYKEIIYVLTQVFIKYKSTICDQSMFLLTSTYFRYPTSNLFPVYVSQYDKKWFLIFDYTDHAV